MPSLTIKRQSAEWKIGMNGIMTFVGGRTASKKRSELNNTK